MLVKAAKLVAYAKAPAKTFMVIHPVKAMKMGVAYLLVKRVLARRHG